MRSPVHSSRAAFTLAEMMVAASILGVFGGLLLASMNAVTVLSAKNGSINFNHQQTRRAVHKLVEEIRESASIPQLLDASMNPTTAATAPGVCYRVALDGWRRVETGGAATGSTLRITCPVDYPQPEPGMRLLIPSFSLKKDIVSVGAPTAGSAGNPAHRQIQVSGTLGAAITCTGGDPIYPVYITRTAALTVVNGELRYYRSLGSGSYSVIATGITTPTPFSLPSSTNNALLVNLDARDSKLGKRNYKAIDTRLTLSVPLRYQLTTQL